MAQAATKTASKGRGVSGIKTFYEETLIPAYLAEGRYTNRLQVPRVTKVIVNIGMGEAVQNVKVLDTAAEELAAITGQRPVITRAKKSIAGFKIRQGMPIGCKVTLRGRRMYEFVERLLHAVLPRLRDFRGVSAKAFDGRGNYTLGLKEQLIFPEIEYDTVQLVHGMDVTFVTTAGDDAAAKDLLARLGMPFREAR
ncbi:MAG TPA: 50S ribosomal protein L5 [Nitrospiria bacterium]|nr:50S ribosomal protein L5 [Nitrospiria bacterium]